MKKGPIYILSSIYCQNVSVSPFIKDLVDLCPNLWCNNSKPTFFLGAIFFDLYFSFVFTKDACLFCALCGNVTAFFSFPPNYTVQNPLWNNQLCLEFIKLTPRVWNSSLNSVKVNFVPASAEILSKYHHPNSSIFPNIDWNISNLSITSYVAILSIS